MIKQQLIEKVAAKTELKKSEVEVAVDSVLAMIAEALQANERVDLRGFGSFVVKERQEGQGRTPPTGGATTIAAQREAGAPRPHPSHRGDHHHRGKTGCGLQARQGTDGKAGSRRDGSDAGRSRMMSPEGSGRDGGAVWLR